MSQVIRISDDMDKKIFERASCVFGVFDGVHRGHRFLIRRAMQTAYMSGGPSVALTFAIDPDELFAPRSLMKLMSNEERIAALSRTGVDVVAVLPFDRSFAKLSPRAFLDWTFGDNAPFFMHVGEGFRFGCKGAGTPSDIAAWRSGMINVCVHELVSAQGAPVSATRVRELLARGDAKTARDLLGQESFALVAAV